MHTVKEEETRKCKKKGMCKEKDKQYRNKLGVAISSSFVLAQDGAAHVLKSLTFNTCFLNPASQLLLNLPVFFFPWCKLAFLQTVFHVHFELIHHLGQIIKWASWACTRHPQTVESSSVGKWEKKKKTLTLLNSKTIYYQNMDIKKMSSWTEYSSLFHLLLSSSNSRG